VLACMLLCAALVQEVERVREDGPGGVVVEREVVRGADGEAIPHGDYLEWWPDGGRKVEGRYREGARHGKWRAWHPGGERAASGYYKYGLRDREWTVWAPDGTLVEGESGEFAVSELRGRGGRLRARGETRGGVRHGSWTFFWEQGVPQVRCSYRDGALEGPLVFFHPEGTPDPAWISGRYAGGLRVGPLAPELVPAREPAPPPRGAIADLLEELRTEPAERARALERLFELGLDDERLADVLLPLDLGDPDEAALATELLRERVLPLWNAAFYWGAGEPPETSEGFALSPLSRLRWVSLLRTADADVRLLALPLERQARAAGDHPLWLETLHPLPADVRAARDVSSGLYAGRFGHHVGPAAEAVARGLDWLARHQQEDGSWDCGGFVARCRSDVPCDGPGTDLGVDVTNDVGVSALALLAFLGDGHTSRQGAHREVVARGLTWLVGQQGREGSLGPTTYNHAVATAALAEAAFFSDSERLGTALQRAVEFAEQARNPYSAWRYDVPPNGQSDTSVTAWMAVGLRLAREAGARVDEAVFDGALSWLDEVSDPSTGRAGYNQPGGWSSRVEGVNDHYPPDKAETMTAATLLCRYMLGQTPEDAPILEKHAQLMVRTLPAWDPDGFGCDFYYWYYGSQALHQMEGTAYWKTWHKALLEALLQSQRTEDEVGGSWDPVGPWGFSGGRIYSTAMAVLALEADSRYAPLGTPRGRR